MQRVEKGEGGEKVCKGKGENDKGERRRSKESEKGKERGGDGPEEKGSLK